MAENTMDGATGNGVVQIAYLHNEQVSHSWVESMRRAWRYDVDSGRRVLAGAPMNMRCGAGMVAHIRNYATQLFLDKTPHEWLMWVDTDMGFEDDAIHRLLDAADPAERPIVGGLCFAFMEAAFDGFNGWRRTIVPTMYQLGTTVEGGNAAFCFYGEYADDTVTPVAATGGAFILVHRSVYERLREAPVGPGRTRLGDHWYDMVYDSVGDIVGEDIAFCARALKIPGVIPHVHTGVKTTHHKEVWLSEVDYLVQGSAAGPQVVHPELPLQIHLGGSFSALAANAHEQGGMLKFREDLARYEAIIANTKPQVIVETGTHTGASARWLASQGADVVTVDILSEVEHVETIEGRTVTYVPGDSSDPVVADHITELVGDRRCMVILDSDHSAEHVTKEIDLYGPLVAPGCYLVVEDGVFAYAPPQLLQQHFPGGLVGSPLDAVQSRLVGRPEWSRDIAIERAHPVSQNPAGWWMRNG